jgi:hypothetical protein
MRLRQNNADNLKQTFTPRLCRNYGIMAAEETVTSAKLALRIIKDIAEQAGIEHFNTNQKQFLSMK